MASRDSEASPIRHIRLHAGKLPPQRFPIHPKEQGPTRQKGQGEGVHLASLDKKRQKNVSSISYILRFKCKEKSSKYAFQFWEHVDSKKNYPFCWPKKKIRKWKKIWTKVWSQGNCGPNRRLFSNSKIEAEERWKNATAEISPKPDVFVLPPTCYFSDHVEFLPREPILYPARNFGRHRHYFDPRLLFRWCKMPPRVNICVRNAGLNITLIFPNPNLNPNGEKKGIVVL